MRPSRLVLGLTVQGLHHGQQLSGVDASRTTLVARKTPAHAAMSRGPSCHSFRTNGRPVRYPCVNSIIARLDSDGQDAPWRYLNRTRTIAGRVIRSPGSRAGLAAVQSTVDSTCPERCPSCCPPRLGGSTAGSAISVPPMVPSVSRHATALRLLHSRKTDVLIFGMRFCVFGLLVNAPCPSMMCARDRGIEGREDAVRIVAIDPDVAVEMRLEHVGLVSFGAGIVGHRVVRRAVKRRRGGLTCRSPASGEDQVLDCNQLERTVILRLVDEDAWLAEVRVGADAVYARRWRCGDVPSRSGRT